MALTENKGVIFRDLGLIPYAKAWEYQEQVFNGVVKHKVANRDLLEELQTPTENYFIFCEHPPVFTLGKSGDEEHLLLKKEALNFNGIDYFKVNRGGDITHHGPGQVVGYPILDLDNFFTDIHRYLRLLEETIILTLADYGIEADRLAGATGVWLDADQPTKARKICAMGIRCSRWVTMHGFALNVNNDLDFFNHIIPCGITDKGVTSIEKELGKQVDIEEVKQHITHHFLYLFQATVAKQPISHVTI